VRPSARTARHRVHPKCGVALRSCCFQTRETPIGRLGRLMPELPTTSSTDVPAQSYEQFLEDIKGRIRSAQARAARAINAELIKVYWQIGCEILQRQAEEGPELGRRTRGVVQRLSTDLRAAFPGARGYSVPNLYRMRAFAAAWPDPQGLSDRVRDLPWGHVATLVAVKDPNVRDWYVQRAGAWSHRQLQTAIATGLHEREGAAITNFDQALEAGDAEIVQQIARDPVVLDFVRLTEGSRERDLEAALLIDIERFMLALGEGFYFAGRQKSLEIGGEEFILDLLFYHHPTRRFVVIDLKIGSFQAEFAGKMNLYVNGVQMAGEDAQVTEGLGRR
jgi:predicted nuclease of restriction endonuclease-like (RecB) superfamily